MALQAQCRLRLALEWCMAFLAALFILLMGLGQLARHDELLEDALRCGWVRRRRNSDRKNKRHKPTHDRNSRSVQMHGDDVHNHRDDEHQEERQVQKVPEREQAFIDR